MNVDENDLEKQLDARLQELEAARAKEIDAAIAAKKAQDEQERRQRQVASLAALVKSTGILVFMTDSALADALDKNGFEHTEDGLRQLIGKYPHIVDRRLGKRFLESVKEAPKPEKPKNRSDYPSSRSEFTEAQKVEFLNTFPLEVWEAMPSKPRASAVPLNKMTKADWRSLTTAQKTERINELVAQGKDPEAFITRLPETIS